MVDSAKYLQMNLFCDPKHTCKNNWEHVNQVGNFSLPNYKIRLKASKTIPLRKELSRPCLWLRPRE